jgi:hypothetical protein
MFATKAQTLPWKGTPFGATTLGITTFSIMTLSIKYIFETLRINDMKSTYCLFQVKFITEYTNVQHIIITQI